MVVGTSRGPQIPQQATGATLQGEGLPALFGRFVDASPLTVMTRALLERTLRPEALDQLFLEHAITQINHELLFSSVVDLFSQVALRIHPSMRRAYLDNPHHQSVSLSALYQKINHLEPQLGPALVRHSVGLLQEVLGAMPGSLRPSWRAGYRVKILDGNHFGGTDHRLKVLRGTAAAALPGQVLAVLDPRQRLFLDLIPCEDAYTQERLLLERVLPSVDSGDVWVADRNFCTPKFLTGISRRRGCFAIREHAQLNIRHSTELREAGRCRSGQVFEQQAEVTDDQTGEVVQVRRVLVKLHEPTRDKETEVAVLTNLPPEVADAVAVADLYLERWTIEVAFGALTVVLRCEVAALGYPRAALFSFAVAVLAANVLGGLQAALAAVHGPHAVASDLSVYQVATDVAGIYQGMMIAIPAPHWHMWAQMSPSEFVTAVLDLAAKADWGRLRKAHASPKKPPPSRPSAKDRRHVSTARLLKQVKEEKEQARAS